MGKIIHPLPPPLISPLIVGIIRQVTLERCFTTLVTVFTLQQMLKRRHFNLLFRSEFV